MRVMTEKVQALFEKANEGLTDRTPEICGIYGRACHEMGRNPSRMPCLHCPLPAPPRLDEEEGRGRRRIRWPGLLRLEFVGQ